MSKIKVLDLFAGPGGLGEGFSAYADSSGNKPFESVLSVEKESSAHMTLTLRSYFRNLLRNGEPLDDYFEYMRGMRSSPFTEKTSSLWQAAKDEAIQETLGSEMGDARVMELARNRIGKTDKWILIGGPPCQAYSLIGRARNRGVVGYSADSDHRHFLYKAYLDLLAELKPPVFLLENVKGILTSKVSGELIFPSMLRDLSNPSVAIGKKDGPKYKIHSIVGTETYEFGQDPEKSVASRYIVKSELFGLPQARHRVILVGVRDDIGNRPESLKLMDAPSISDVIGNMPSLRSGLSKLDSADDWLVKVTTYAKELREEFSQTDNKLSQEFAELETYFAGIDASQLSRGSMFVESIKTAEHGVVNDWIANNAPKAGFANHLTRGHMSDDLKRYMYTATFGQLYGRSPKAKDFPLNLSPKHKSWLTGNFGDRFKVQLKDNYSTTITSHISKDGHYYIHPDAKQCRSFTVREAARLQTFPDNYYFEGNRTQQFTQVGNAVPPFLGKLIAESIFNLLS